MSAVKAARNELSRLAGGRAPKGRRGSHTHGVVTTLPFTLRGRNAPFVSLAAAIMAVLFAMRNDTCMGNPSGPSGHLPCKAEEFASGRTSDGKQCVCPKRISPVVKSPKLETVPRTYPPLRLYKKTSTCSLTIHSRLTIKILTPDIPGL